MILLSIGRILSGGTTWWSAEAGFERGSIRDTARIQRVLIGDRCALQSERVIFKTRSHQRADQSPLTPTLEKWTDRQ